MEAPRSTKLKENKSVKQCLYWQDFVIHRNATMGDVAGKSLVKFDRMVEIASAVQKPAQALERM
jgi:hypothetical protein